MDWLIVGLLAFIVFLLILIFKYIRFISDNLLGINGYARDIQFGVSDVLNHLDSLREDARDISQMLSRGKAIVTTKPMWDDNRSS